MIDRWFIDDINGALCNCGRAVFTDAHEEGKFLLDFLPNDVVLLEIASSDLDEIKAKYEVETHHADENIIRKTKCSTIVKRNDIFPKRNVYFFGIPPLYKKMWL